MFDCEFILKDNFHLFCNTNEALLKGAIRGIVMEFPGLDGGSCLGGQMDAEAYNGDYAQALAEQSVLLIYTCPGPWSWMNRGAVRICDLIESAAIEHFSLPQDIPTVASGGSMGGLGAIIWAMRTKHNVVACAAACPCYDVLEAYRFRPDFDRTYLAAVAAYDMTFEEALKSISPVHILDSLANVPYYIVGDGDDACFPLDGMDRFVDAMRARGLSVDYRRLPDLPHGGFTAEARDGLTEFVIRSVNGARR